MNFFKKLFLCFGFLLIACLPVLAHADQISLSLPGIPQDANPAEMVNGLYLYALSIGGLLAFGMIVYGGVRYTLSAGNPGLQSDAKDTIYQALLGLLLLLAAYLILSIINPGLTTLILPSLEPLPETTPTSGAGAPCDITCARPGEVCRLDFQGNPQCQTPTNLAGPGGNCKDPAAAVVSDLQGTCFDDNDGLETAASGVFTLESRGNRFIESGTDHCLDDNSFSIGFAQVNYLANGSVVGGPCSNINNYFTIQNGSPSHPQGNCVDRNSRGICMHWNCRLNTSIPGAQQALADCKKATIENNMEVACKLYRDAARRGNGFSPWATSFNRCGYARQPSI